MNFSLRDVVRFIGELAVGIGYVLFAAAIGCFVMAMISARGGRV